MDTCKNLLVKFCITKLKFCSRVCEFTEKMLRYLFISPLKSAFTFVLICVTLQSNFFLSQKFFRVKSHLVINRRFAVRQSPYNQYPPFIYAYSSTIMWNEFSEKDEILAKLESNPKGEDRVDLLMSLAYIERRGIEKSSSYIEQAESEISQTPSLFEVAKTDILFIRAFQTHVLLGNMLEAIPMYQEAMARYASLNNKQGEYECGLKLLNLFSYSYRFSEAWDIVNRCKELISNEVNASKNQARFDYILATLYGRLELLDLTKSYAESSLKKGEEDQNALLQVGNLWLLSNLSNENGDHSRALAYALRYLEIGRSVDEKPWIAGALAQVGYCHWKLGNYNEAKDFLLEILDLENLNTQANADCYLQLGRVYKSSQNYEEAEKWLNKALKIYEENKVESLALTCIQELHSLYKTQNLFAEAHHYLEIYMERRTKNWEKDNKKQISILAAQYEYKQKTREAEIYKKNSKVLSKKNDLLREAYNERQEVLTLVAHDLRNALSSIMLRSEAVPMLVEMKNYNKLVDNALQIRQAVGYMDAILEQLNAMDMVDKNELQVNLENISIFEALGQVLNQNLAYAKKKNIKVEVDVPKNVYVLADILLLKLSLDNVISNSIKYSHPNSTFWISIEIEQGRLNLHFKDRGVGIAEKELHKLFQKFGRLESSRPTNNEKSTGLGLYITKKQLEAMNGTISASSEGLGKGTTFTMNLPLGSRVVNSI